MNRKSRKSRNSRKNKERPEPRALALQSLREAPKSCEAAADVPYVADEVSTWAD